MVVIERSYDENDQAVEKVEQELEIDLGIGCDHCEDELKDLEDQFIKAGASIPKYETDNYDERRKARENRGLVMFFHPDYNSSGYSGPFHVEVLQQSEYTILTEKKGEKDEK